jgi:FKBP-type peptidyl-prolyl cis-trans isomerase FkpA
MHAWFKVGLVVTIFGGLPVLHAATKADAAVKPDAAPNPDTLTDDERTLYALGALLSHNVDGWGLSDRELNIVRQGFADGYHRLPATKDAETLVPQIQALQRDRMQKAADAYLVTAAAAPGANKTASGLIYIPVKEGSGSKPRSSDRVKVNYEGRLLDGTVFDSSSTHGGPATFPLSGVIPCWTEALQLMKVGGKSRIVCPSDIAYGERGSPPKIRPNATLEFDVELLAIE